MTRTQWIGVAAFLLVIVGAGALMLSTDREAVPVPLEIGPDTTRITAPLDANGEVDYVAALNAGDLPDPADNAAIPLIRAIGTLALLGDAPDVLVQLGAPDDMPEVTSFVEPDDAIEFEHAVEDLGRPRSEAHAAAFDGWIVANADTLALLDAASERPRIWVPVVHEEPGGVIRNAIPVDRVLAMCEVLAAHADRARARSDAEAAWADTQTLLRIESRMDQLRGSIAYAIASGIRSLAFDVIENVLVAGSPSEPLATEMLLVLSTLPPRRTARSDIDTFDRFMVLDGFLRDLPRTPAGEREAGALDINLILRSINAGIDDVIALLEPVTRENVEALERLVDQTLTRVRQSGIDLNNPIGQVRHVLGPERRERESRLIGTVLASIVMAVVPNTISTMARLERRRHHLVIAAAVRLHALRHGSLPESLDALMPNTLTALPEHVLVDPIPYQQQDGECFIGDDAQGIRMRR